MSKQVSFKVSEEDKVLIASIVKRAIKDGIINKCQHLDLSMDITATHANGCQLDLARLLQADDFNFRHDIFGIVKHLDRTCGALTNHFLPRFASPAKEAN